MGFEQRILFADNHLLVVDKPAGAPLVPDESGDPSTLAAAKEWVRRTKNKPGEAFLGVVHRLDRPVSGVVVFARTSKAARRLQQQFRERRVRKTYWGVAAARPAQEQGELGQWLLKDQVRNLVQAVAPGTPGALYAETRWRILEVRTEGRGTRVLLELSPLSGRPHQLRVAAAALGAPLLGDLKYGAASALPDKSVALHAARLELEHPTRGQQLTFDSPPPALDAWRFQALGR
jgi:23S rRNA pseudouridine1911/1915/1917 synthase